MNSSKAILVLPILAMAGLIFSGCLNLKPAIDSSRFFVLGPDAAMTTGSPQPNQGPRVGIGRVQVADYLQHKQLVSRKGDHELEYWENCYWGESLEKGVTRVLGVNLASMLGPTRVLTSNWRRGDVEAEVYVSIQRFESDPQGRVVLEARWRITNPGATQPWRTGQAKIFKQGPAPTTNPDGLVGTMSRALGDLSVEIAAALHAASSLRPPP